MWHRFYTHTRTHTHAHTHTHARTHTHTHGTEEAESADTHTCLGEFHASGGNLLTTPNCPGEKKSRQRSGIKCQQPAMCFVSYALIIYMVSNMWRDLLIWGDPAEMRPGYISYGVVCVCVCVGVCVWLGCVWLAGDGSVRLEVLARTSGPGRPCCCCCWITKLSRVGVSATATQTRQNCANRKLNKRTKWRRK